MYILKVIGQSLAKFPIASIATHLLFGFSVHLPRNLKCGILKSTYPAPRSLAKEKKERVPGIRIRCQGWHELKGNIILQAATT